MTGYQDFVSIFGKGIFIKSSEIKSKYSFQKALSSLFIIPTFFRGVYYIPSKRERDGKFIENPQDFLISLFNIQYGRKKWYWALSTAARYYGFEWSATKILEIVTMERPKTIEISHRISNLENKSSYRSASLAHYYESLNINAIYIHKGNRGSIDSSKIDDELGPVSSKDQLLIDIIKYKTKTRNKRMKKIYERILHEFDNSEIFTDKHKG